MPFVCFQLYKDFQLTMISLNKSIKALCQSPFANQLAVDGFDGLGNVCEPLQCSDCQQIFYSKQAVAVHAFRKHGTRRAERFFVDSSAVCFACLLQFSSRTRCIEHLAEKSATCLAFLQNHHTPLDSDVVSALDDVDRVNNKKSKSSGCRRAGQEAPCVRLSGPTRLVSEFRHPLGPNRRYIAAIGPCGL